MTASTISTLKPPTFPQKPVKAAPKHLKKAGRELWEHISKTYELEAHHIVLLNSLCETLDKKNLAEAELRKAGALTFKNRHGENKPHAAVAISRDCNILMARLTRELNLSEEEPPDTKRPPRLKYGGRK